LYAEVGLRRCHAPAHNNNNNNAPPFALPATDPAS
jgi:hypothetical protein